MARTTARQQSGGAASGGDEAAGRSGRLNIILADDHAMLREGLRRQFEDCRDMKVVHEVGTAADLIMALRTTSQGIIILDVKLPDANGFMLTRKIKSFAPKMRIVVLTMYNHVRYAISALESGADAFVVKGAPFEELLRAVRSVRDGRTYVCSEIAPDLIGRFKKRTKRQDSLDTLSQREFEVLTMLSGGLTLKQMGKRMGISEKTVSTYRTRLMEKLNLESNTDLVRFALEAGLIE